jgi:hypothetical protein
MTNYCNDTELLVAIFRKANPLEPQSSVAEYLHHFEFEIDRVGRALRFLGLAEQSDQCDLGWAPNRRLMRIIAEQAARPFHDAVVSNEERERGDVEVSNEDRDFVDLIYYVATGDVKEEVSMDGTDFYCDVLEIFGLLERGEGEDGDFALKPTPRMKDLVLKRLLERALSEAEDGEDEDE